MEEKSKDIENTKEKYKFLGRRERIKAERRLQCTKNGTFCISHLCSRNDNALKIHYYLIQIAHIIRQLLEYGSLVVREMMFKTKREVTKFISENITSHNLAEIPLNKNFQLRFSDS